MCRSLTSYTALTNHRTSRWHSTSYTSSRRKYPVSFDAHTVASMPWKCSIAASQFASLAMVPVFNVVSFSSWLDKPVLGKKMAHVGDQFWGSSSGLMKPKVYYTWLGRGCYASVQADHLFVSYKQVCSLDSGAQNRSTHTMVREFI